MQQMNHGVSGMYTFTQIQLKLKMIQPNQFIQHSHKIRFLILILQDGYSKVQSKAIISQLVEHSKFLAVIMCSV